MHWYQTWNQFGLRICTARLGRRKLFDHRLFVAHKSEDFFRQILFHSSSEGLVEYIEIVDTYTLEPKTHFDKSCTVCVAVWFGDVRLIDNVSHEDNDH